MLVSINKVMIGLFVIFELHVNACCSSVSTFFVYAMCHVNEWKLSTGATVKQSAYIHVPLADC